MKLILKKDLLIFFKILYFTDTREYLKNNLQISILKKMKSKKVIQYCENSMKMYMILRCEFVELSLDELNLKAKFFQDEGNETEKSLNRSTLDKTYFDF